MDNTTQGLIEVAKQTAELKSRVIAVYAWTGVAIIVALLAIFAVRRYVETKRERHEAQCNLLNSMARADAECNARYGRVT